MKPTLTHSALIALKPCDLEARLALFDAAGLKHMNVSQAFAAIRDYIVTLWS